MVSTQIWILVIAFSVPMIISPGPGNTMLAAAGGRFGVKGTVPFWLGFELANFVWCLAYGFGLSRLLDQAPSAAHALKWAGIAYTLYLAYGFVKPSKPGEHADLPELTITDGFLSVSLNPKIHSMIFVLFSQCLRSDLALAQQVLQISAVFTVLCIACHFPWIYGGQIIFKRFSDPKAMRVQGYLFGACMAAVAVFVAVST
ncbi:LysE family translocator [Trinickia sp. LjRoot230]|uniref:LysE family translocator n=1 Tax=Trinickia sp. LjRoot230 TaxID=3342288 RepID=UPI003ECC47C4